MKEEYKVEKGIEIPKRSSGTQSKYPWRQMKKGDSFVYGEYTRENMRRIAASARSWKLKSGDCTDWEFICRKTKDNEVRIWRIK